MANNYLYSGRVINIPSSGGAIASGALVMQDGFIGIALQSTSGAAEELDIAQDGVWDIAVPSGVIRGDVLYADLAGGDSEAITLTETGTTNTTIGIAITDRDADGNAHVKLTGLGHVGAVVADA